MNPTARIRPFGDRAWLLDRWDADLPGLAMFLSAAYPQATVVSGLDSILLEFPENCAMPSGRAVGELLGSFAAGAQASIRTGRTHTVPVQYCGPDLSDLAGMLGCSTTELVAVHQRTSWVVAAVGFAPGFAYLSCDDPLWRKVRRRSQPRSAVPAGSVAVAAGMSGIYPTSSPGGWQLIGTTRTVLFDAGRTPAALMAVGDTVRFVAETRRGAPS